jgi:molecular chaperone DnaK (HSP70)
MALFHMKPNATSVDGREMPLMTVISESLKFIAGKAVAKLEEQIGKVMTLKKIRWVLTVPALWGEEHKLFMKKAAVEAGIIEHSSSTNLLLCLEPEGASIQCREDAEDDLRKEMNKGDIVMVLDCGGGTVDITVHKLTCDVQEKFCCEEILPTSGGCEWGSKYVDKYFEEFLKEFFKEEIYNIYVKNPIARLEILKHFELLKR